MKPLWLLTQDEQGSLRRDLHQLFWDTHNKDQVELLKSTHARLRLFGFLTLGALALGIAELLRVGFGGWPLVIYWLFALFVWIRCRVYWRRCKELKRGLARFIPDYQGNVEKIDKHNRGIEWLQTKHDVELTGYFVPGGSDEKSV